MCKEKISKCPTCGQKVIKELVSDSTFVQYQPRVYNYIPKENQETLDEVLKEIDKIPNHNKGYTKYEFTRIIEQMKEEL